MDNSEVSKSNLKILTKCPVDKLTKLLHSVCDKMCGRHPANYADVEAIYSVDEWWEVLEMCTDTLRRLIKEEDPLKTLTEMGFSPDYQKVFKDCVVSRGEEVRQALLTHTTSDGAKSFLKDFDWSLKLALGSDKVSDIRQALASLHFHTVQGQHNRQFTLEMNKKELAELIQALENANKALFQLQT